MKWLRNLSPIAVALTIAACAPQPINVDSNDWNRSGRRIGLVMTELPAAKTYKEGAQDLLDMAIDDSMAGWPGRL